MRSLFLLAVEETIQIRHGSEQAEVHIGLRYVLPAAGIHVAHLHQIGADQRLHLLGFKQQLVAVQGRIIGRRILGEDPGHHLFRMQHGVTPPLEAGFAKGSDSCPVVAQFTLGGKQVVTVEVDTGAAGSKGLIGHTALLQCVGFIRVVGAHGVHFAPN